MNEEKMMVLKMLEEGKISAEEAAKLLDALKNNKKTGEDNIKNMTQNVENKMDNFNKNIEDWSKDIGKKIEIFSKDIEPKIMKATQAFIEKTTQVADKLSKTIIESEVVKKNKVCKEISYDTSDISDRNLILNACNDKLFLRGYNGDEINAKLYYKGDGDGNFYFNDNEKDIELCYDEDGYSSVSIELLIPQDLFKKIYLNNINSSINIKNVYTEKLLCETSNAPINIENVDCIDIKGDTSNASIIFKNDKEYFTKDMYNIVLNTSNGDVILDIPREDLGYKFITNTSNGEIKIRDFDLYYDKNEKMAIVANTKDYNECKTKIKIDIDTSNSSIKIS